MDTQRVLFEKRQESGLMAGIIPFHQPDRIRHVLTVDVASAINLGQHPGMPTRQDTGDTGNGKDIADPMPMAKEYKTVEDVIGKGFQERVRLL